MCAASRRTLVVAPGTWMATSSRAGRPVAEGFAAPHPTVSEARRRTRRMQHLLVHHIKSVGCPAIPDLPRQWWLRGHTEAPTPIPPREIRGLLAGARLANACSRG